MTFKLGLIPGIIGAQMKQDFWATAAEVARIGYEGLEGGGKVMEGDVAAVKEARKRLNDLGLEMPTASVSKDALGRDIRPMLEKAVAAGAQHVSLWWAECKTREMVLADCELFNKAGETIAEFGLKFCYHNHDHEFKNVFDGVRAIDLLFANTDPSCVHFEIDVAWVTYGGDDPAAFLNAHKGRVPVIHLKDIADLSQRAKFTAVGTGVVKTRASVLAAVANGARWVVVEQDAPNVLTPMESVQASFLNIKEMGLLRDRG